MGTAFLHTISEEGSGDDYGTGNTMNGLHMRRHSVMQSNNTSSSSNNVNNATTQNISFEDSLNPGAKKKRHSGLFGLDCPSSPSKNQEYFRGHKFSLRNYLLRESLGIGEPGHLEPAAVGTYSLAIDNMTFVRFSYNGLISHLLTHPIIPLQHTVSTGYMDNFLAVPSKVEKLITFGFFICLDAFLYVLTVLPIRVAYSIGLLICETACWLRYIHTLPTRHNDMP